MSTEMANTILAVHIGLQRNDKCCFSYTLPYHDVRKIGTYGIDSTGPKLSHASKQIHAKYTFNLISGHGM